MRVIHLPVQLAILLSILGSPAAAQPLLRGQVVDDATGAPIAGAAVELLASPTARPLRGVLADAEGRFTLPGRTGANHLRARRIGYRDSRTVELTLGRGDTVEVEIRLAVGAVLMAPIEVVSRPAPRHTHPGLEGFYHRMERGIGGWFLTREQIEQSHGSDAGQLLHGSGIEIHGHLRRGEAVVANTRQQCPPEIYLDGQRLTHGYDRFSPNTEMALRMRVAAEALNLVMVRELEGVEVYRGAASVPGDFGGSSARCGVVVFWSRRGLAQR